MVIAGKDNGLWLLAALSKNSFYGHSTTTGEEPICGPKFLPEHSKKKWRRIMLSKATLIHMGPI
jgi:hypothetical protein